MILARPHNRVHMNLRRINWLHQTSGLEVVINANYNTHSSFVPQWAVLPPLEQPNMALL